MFSGSESAGDEDDDYETEGHLGGSLPLPGVGMRMSVSTQVCGAPALHPLHPRASGVFTPAPATLAPPAPLPWHTALHGPSRVAWQELKELDVQLEQESLMAKKAL